MRRSVAPQRSRVRHWDPLDVWRRLLREHPVSIDDPAGSTGCMDPCNARLFWVTIADFPAPLQDAMFVIAHARGFEAALAALDQAIRAHLANRCRRARGSERRAAEIRPSVP